MEDTRTPNSTEVIPLRNRGRPKGKGQRAKEVVETKEVNKSPPPKGQLDKAAFKEWKLKLGKEANIKRHRGHGGQKG